MIVEDGIEEDEVRREAEVARRGQGNNLKENDHGEQRAHTDNHGKQDKIENLDVQEKTAYEV